MSGTNSATKLPALLTPADSLPQLAPKPEASGPLKLTTDPTVSVHLKASVDQYLLELVDPFHKGRRETVVADRGRGTAPPVA
eukprot:Skav204871  [mRNA]  locus=scaffold1679:99634:100320:- [translate_table: standard]